MISHSAKKSLLYQEIADDKRKEYFDYKSRGFLHNIDTLYYVVKVDGDWRNDSNALLFKDVLYDFQSKAILESEMLQVFTQEQMDYYGMKSLESSEWLMNGIAASKIYRIDLQQADKFAVFIASSTPNESTPELIVQLRSQYLWLLGEKNAVLESLKEIESLLDLFGLKIKEVKENRIDYAYHTNYIQDPTNYFKHQNINKMQQSRFSRGSIEFSFRNQWETETDYLTLGRKKSNNLFFRIYDKTKEVIQQGYKQFFIEIWYQKKLISYFDRFCLEKAFMNPSADNYKYLDCARLEFYLEYGSNEDYKAMIRGLLNQQSRNYSAIIELADLLTPKVTKILNVELETKRKFYSTLDNTIHSLLSVTSENVPAHADKLFRILDNKKLFHDYITRNTLDGSGVIRFIDFRKKNRLGQPWKHKRDFPTSDFWQRLQNVSTEWEAPNITLVREYQKNLSINLLKKRITNQLSSFSLYKNGQIKNDTYADALDFISTLNETDLEKANQYKEKKYLLLKARLEESEVSLAKENNFGIVNMETGEIIASDSQEESVEYDDYNTSELVKDDTTFVINSVDEIFDSLMHDYHLKKREYEIILKGNLNKNQKLAYQLKLDKINEKINSLRNM